MDDQNMPPNPNSNQWQPQNQGAGLINSPQGAMQQQYGQQRPWQAPPPPPSPALGKWQAISSDPRFSVLSGEMHHPLSHQEALDSAAVEHGCAIPSDLTVTFDAAGEAMRNSPVTA